MDKKGLVGMVLGIVSIVLVIVALVGINWVNGDVDTGFGKAEMTYGLFNAKSSFVGVEKTFSYSDDEMSNSSVADSISTPRVVVIVGLVLGVLFLILGLMAAMGKMKGTLPLVLGLLAGIIVLVGAVMAAGAIKSGIEDDYADVGNYSFGNGSMFYLALVGAILFIVAGVMMKGAGKEQPVAMPPAMAPAPEYQPQAPMPPQ